ncbi:MAG TPA: hypothetical protein VJW77_07035 [Terriglobia bacterium]|nr:hypothetical protein [Terriglobia bacterium]HKT11566.1 hypothetical protein [Terriglobia bacterium]
MGNILYWILTVTVAVVAIYLFYRLYGSALTYFRFRGERLVTCPETHTTAAVELDAKEAARTSLTQKPRMQLSGCSRWPQRKDCGQECLGEIERSPSDCLVRNIVINWFEEKSCVFCGKSMAEVKEWWVDHKPALLTPEKRIVVWNEFAAEQLPELFQRCEPVCWSCATTEKFRKEHPDLVSERAPTPLRIQHIK